MQSDEADFELVREIALALPEVKESTMHGAPSLKVRGRLLACPALHSSAEPNTLAVRIDFPERAKLLKTKPGIFYVTDHYLSYSTVLVRLSRIDRACLIDLLDMAWRFVRAKTTRSRVRSERRPKRK